MIVQLTFSPPDWPKLPPLLFYSVLEHWTILLIKGEPLG